jgi:hypothetical protein
MDLYCSFVLIVIVPDNDNMVTNLRGFVKRFRRRARKKAREAHLGVENCLE